MTVDLDKNSQISTSGPRSHGIHAQSVGGSGGNGGYTIDVSAGAALPTVSLSLGGSGGAGGNGDEVTIGSDAAFGQGGGVTTGGDDSNGLFGQSIGGGGGNGGFSMAFSADVGAPGEIGALSFAVGGEGGSGRAGRPVDITSESAVETSGDRSSGVVAQAVGGSGGNGGLAISGTLNIGGSGGGAAIGGTGGTGGDAEQVSVISNNTVTTSGLKAKGILAQSVGGGGGNGGLSFDGNVTLSGGGSATVGIALGGSGGVGGNSYNTGSDPTTSTVTVTSNGSVVTGGDLAEGILAQSIGGGGGNGGLAISGTMSGGGGQSINLGGGLGGGGAAGGDGGDIVVTANDAVTTSGGQASAIVAQSIGGGGGNGGTAISASVMTSQSNSAQIALGGVGGSGGSSDTVSVTANANVTAKGMQSDAIVGQSIAGGGGTGGIAMTGSLSMAEGHSANFSIGGTGRRGEAANSVIVRTRTGTSIGDGGRGIVAQSIGGGGGNGGAAYTGTFAKEDSTKSFQLSLGGGAGKTGRADIVTVINRGDVSTGSVTEAESGLTGEHGILAQSIGGGGGSGGLSASGADNGGNRSLAVNIGGAGGSGGAGSQATVDNYGAITVLGRQSTGIVAQSISGGGGHGGGSVTFSKNGGEDDPDSKGVQLDIGGKGGGGAGSSTASVRLAHGSAITASNLGGQGIVAQSIAGGGGTGGSNIYKDSSGKSTTTDQLTVGIGGSVADTSSNGGVVDLGMLDTSGFGGFTITTGGGVTTSDDNTFRGHAVHLQSIGGGGGSGGSGIVGNVKPDDSSVAATLGVGGRAAHGGDGNAVNAGFIGSALEGAITTKNYSSHGLFAQSIGGGGGVGGSGIQGDVQNSAGKGLTVGIGASGNGGGSGGTVNVYSAAGITTMGAGSKAIMAQSIGGGGGDGGKGIKGNVTGASDDKSNQLTFGLGGSGGGGGGGDVTVVNSGVIATAENLTSSGTMRGMDGIFAQSVAGGGGNGGIGISGNVTTSGKVNGINVALGFGGSSSIAGDGGVVAVNNSSDITVRGSGSRGILAQSLGGGGGNAGGGINGNLSTSSKATSEKHLDVGIGGSGGAAGKGGQVTVTNTAQINAYLLSGNPPQDSSAAILAQSIGGGGGNGGVGITGDVTGTENTKALVLGVGGKGGDGGDAAQGTSTRAGIVINNYANLGAEGDNARAIHAQSIGGGGGNGAIRLNGKVDTGKGKTVTATLGMVGGSGGAGGSISVYNDGNIIVGRSTPVVGNQISDSHGIFAQSIGGGGGTGMLTGGLLYGSTSSTAQKGVAYSVGGAGSGGDGKTVTADNNGVVETYNHGSHGMYLQSIGGGGGHAGSLGGMGTEAKSDTWAAGISVGGGSVCDGGTVCSGGGAGNGASVNAYLTAGAGKTVTFGDASHGLFLQSIGGGGGAAGAAGGLSATPAQGAPNHTTQNADLLVNVGGGAGSTGDGGAIVVGNGIFGEAAVGKIETSGDYSSGIFAQSVGGGGGAGADGFKGSKATVSIGGTGKSHGSGDAALITFGGDITTRGEASHGIFAQSIGGGGGVGGALNLTGTGDWGAGLDIGADGTNSGDGGAQIVALDGATISVGGVHGAGIFAQSVGGGGGVKGDNTGTSGATIGSGGGAGTAGQVGVTVKTSSVETTGDFGHAIFAQAAGGSSGNSGGGVGVTLEDATVSAAGIGAAGIIGQSTASGADFGGVSISIDGASSVSGGGGTPQQSAGLNAAIIDRDGTDNTITNHGSVTSANGASGIAVKYSGDSRTTVTNSGHITGSFEGNVATGPTPESLAMRKAGLEVINRSAGLIELGGSTNVDSLLNLGRMEVGGIDTFDELTMSGDLVNMDGARLNFEIGGQVAGGALYDTVASTDTIRFEAGSLLGLNLFGSLRPVEGMMFDLAIAEALSFDGADLFSFVQSSYFTSDRWELSLFDGLGSFAGMPHTSGLDSPEILRLSYTGVAPIPLPATLWLYLSICLVGYGGMRQRR